MPQMSPMFWLYLFSFFTAILMMSIITTFFLSIPTKTETPSQKHLSYTPIWKW